jgi:hypothetical protein
MRASDPLAFRTSLGEFAADMLRKLDDLGIRKTPPERRNAYLDALGWNDPALRVGLMQGCPKNADGQCINSSCGLVVRSLWRLLGVRHALIAPPYVPGSVMVNLRKLANDVGALRPVKQRSDFDAANVRPGDVIFIDRATSQHVFTVIERQGNVFTSIDGGQTAAGDEPCCSIQRRTRTLPAGGLIFEEEKEHQRPITGVVKLDGLPFTAPIIDLVRQSPSAAASGRSESVSEPFEDEREDNPPAAGSTVPCADPRLLLRRDLIDALSALRARLPHATVQAPPCPISPLCSPELQAPHGTGEATHLLRLSTADVRDVGLAGLLGVDRSPGSRAPSVAKTLSATAPLANFTVVALRRGTQREVHVGCPTGGREVSARVDGARWDWLPPFAAPGALYTVFKVQYGGASLHRQWGRQGAITWLRNLCAFYLDRTGVRLGVGDVSHIVGEEIDGHGSHREGRDVDLYALEYPADAPLPGGFLCTGSDPRSLAVSRLRPPASPTGDYASTPAVLAAAERDLVFTRYATILAYCLATWSQVQSFVWHGALALTGVDQIATTALNSGWRSTWGPAPTPDAIASAWSDRRRKLVGQGTADYGSGRGWPPHEDHLHVRLVPNV